jgi:hypothetical protein
MFNVMVAISLSLLVISNCIIKVRFAEIKANFDDRPNLLPCLVVIASLVPVVFSHPSFVGKVVVMTLWVCLILCGIFSPKNKNQRMVKENSSWYWFLFGAIVVFRVVAYRTPLPAFWANYIVIASLVVGLIAINGWQRKEVWAQDYFELSNVYWLIILLAGVLSQKTLGAQIFAGGFLLMSPISWFIEPWLRQYFGGKACHHFITTIPAVGIILVYIGGLLL